jgi:hypothetical protein
MLPVSASTIPIRKQDSLPPTIREPLRNESAELLAKLVGAIGQLGHVDRYRFAALRRRRDVSAVRDSAPDGPEKQRYSAARCRPWEKRL